MTPKMQLAPGDYVTPAFREETNKWLIDFFGYEEDAVTEPPLPQKMNDANLVIPKSTPRTTPRAAKRTETQKTPDTETFSALLEGLKDSFDTMRMPEVKGSWLERREVSAIKKLGVYVPTVRSWELCDRPTLVGTGKLPSIASVMVSRRSEDTASWFSPRFACAIKTPRLPAGVEHIAGTPFKFGLCYDLTLDKKIKGSKTFWMWCWVVVGEDGAIHAPHERRQFVNEIRHKHRVEGVASTSHIYTRRWCVPSLLSAEGERTVEDSRKGVLSTFRQLMLWWKDRPNQWSVGVRKDGHRVIFSIEPEHTAAYFADRDKVVSVGGRAKKIIHFVREHTRSTGAYVKEHVRGLSEFDWNGYHCVVTAPDLRGRIVTDMPLPPEERKRSERSDEFVQIDTVAEMLADAEDTF